MKIIVLGCYTKTALAVITDLAVAGHRLIGGAARESGSRLLRPGSFLKSRHLSSIFRYAHPAEDEVRFQSDVIHACTRYGAQVLIPIGQAVTVHTAKIKRDIEAATGTRVTVADYEIVSRFADKWETFKLASAIGVPCPRTLLLQPSELEAIESLRYPVVVKPRNLTGGEGVRFLASFEELSQMIEDQQSPWRCNDDEESPYIVQEKINGELHDVVLIARDGFVGPILTQHRGRCQIRS
jgi:carbamoylphosphate synthase large subunit